MSWLVRQELGADETVNYREQDFSEVYKDKPFDFIFDSIGGMTVSVTDSLWHGQQPCRVVFLLP